MTNKIDDALYHSGLTAQGCWDQMDDYAKQAIIRFAEHIIQDVADYSEECIIDGWFDVKHAILERYKIVK